MNHAFDPPRLNEFLARYRQNTQAPVRQTPRGEKVSHALSKLLRLRDGRQYFQRSDGSWAQRQPSHQALQTLMNSRVPTLASYEEQLAAVQQSYGIQLGTLNVSRQSEGTEPTGVRRMPIETPDRLRRLNEDLTNHFANF